jgi:hypothetical protein
MKMSEMVSAETILQAAGFEQPERQDMVRCWQASYIGPDGLGTEFLKSRRQERVMSSLLTMEVLMAEGADVLHGVYRKFGIRQFGRYQPSTLFEQLVEFQAADPDQARPRTLVVTGTDDWNGGLHYAEKEFSPLSPVYMEASTVPELIRAIVRTRRHFGPINNLIISGHGSKDSLQLSDGGHYITNEAIARLNALARIKDEDILVPDAKIVLAGCSNGKLGGLAQTISRISGLTVIAAKKATSPEVHEDPDNPGRKIIKFPNKENIVNMLARTLEAWGISCEAPELVYTEEDTAVVYVAGQVAVNATAQLAA